MTAQVLRISAAEYHKRPGLSSSIATILIQQSPAHAKAAHAAYGGEGSTPTRSTDRGSVVHAITLGKGAEYVALDFDDFKTKAAREARDAARAAGRIPILQDDLDAAEKIAARLTANLFERGIELTGESELAIEWHEPSPHGPVLCRCMMDHAWLGGGSARVLDLKVTHNASPAAIEKSAENFGYAIQFAAYTRALVALEPGLAGRLDFLFAFQEPESPYVMNLVRPDGAFREIGERRWRRAVEEWGKAIATDTWPGYGQTVNSLSVPAWALAKEEEHAA